MDEKPNLISRVLDDVRQVVTDPLGKTANSLSKPIRAATLLVIAIGAVWILAKAMA